MSLKRHLWHSDLALVTLKRLGNLTVPWGFSKSLDSDERVGKRVRIEGDMRKEVFYPFGNLSDSAMRKRLTQHKSCGRARACGNSCRLLASCGPLSTDSGECASRADSKECIRGPLN